MEEVEAVKMCFFSLLHTPTPQESNLQKVL